MIWGNHMCRTICSSIPSPLTPYPAPPPLRPSAEEPSVSAKQVAAGKIAHLLQQVKRARLGSACQVQFGLCGWTGTAVGWGVVGKRDRMAPERMM